MKLTSHWKEAVVALAVIGGVATAPFILSSSQVGKMSEWGVPYTPCVWCGKTSHLEIHHKIPQAECTRIGRPELIHDTNNMVCFCRTKGKGCHFYIGHHGINWDYVFTNVDAVLKSGKQ